MSSRDQEEARPGQASLPLEPPNKLEAEEREQLERDDALFHIGQIRQEHPFLKPRPWPLRAPCRFCGCTEGTIRKVGGQNVVRCAECNKQLYNAPKTETDEKPRTVETVRARLKPSQQARILDRDNCRCVCCGRSDQPLTIGHLLSVDDGLRLGATAQELNDDANLAAMCEACNMGQGRRSVSPRTYAAIIWRLVQAEMAREMTDGQVPTVAEKEAPQALPVATVPGSSAQALP